MSECVRGERGRGEREMRGRGSEGVMEEKGVRKVERESGDKIVRAKWTKKAPARG